MSTVASNHNVVRVSGALGKFTVKAEVVDGRLAPPVIISNNMTSNVFMLVDDEDFDRLIQVLNEVHSEVERAKKQ